MKKRNLVAMFLLSIFTFGIYMLYWLGSTRNEMIARNKDLKTPSIIIVLVPLVAAFLMIILTGLFNGNGSLQIFTASLFYISIIACICTFLYFIFQYSKAVDKTLKGRYDFIFLFLMSFVNQVAWMLFIQYDFNKLSDKKLK